MFGTLIENCAIEAPLQGSVVGTVISSGTAIIETDLDANPGFHQTVDRQAGLRSRKVVRGRNCDPAVTRAPRRYRAVDDGLH